MEALTVLMIGVAVLAAPVVNAVMQRRYLARGESWLRSTAKSGTLGLLAMFGILSIYFVIGTLLMKAFT